MPSTRRAANEHPSQSSMTVVPGLPVLRAMAKAKLITLHEDTGRKVRHWTGQSVRAYYVKDAADRFFEFRGRQYRMVFFGGCFCPFIADIEAAKSLGIDLDGNLIV